MIQIRVERLRVVPNGGEPSERGVNGSVRGTELGVGLLQYDASNRDGCRAITPTTSAIGPSAD